MDMQNNQKELTFDEFMDKLDEWSDEDDDYVYEESGLDGYSDFYKKNKNNKIWWIDHLGYIGEHIFSFDKKKLYNLFQDYPYKLTPEEKEIFDAEEPYWADFFKSRNAPS